METTVKRCLFEFFEIYFTLVAPQTCTPSKRKIEVTQRMTGMEHRPINRTYDIYAPSVTRSVSLWCNII